MRYNHKGFQIQARIIGQAAVQRNGKVYRDVRAENARRMAAAMARGTC